MIKTPQEIKENSHKKTVAEKGLQAALDHAKWIRTETYFAPGRSLEDIRTAIDRVLATQ